MVRYFPRAQRRRVVAALVVCALAASPLVVSVSSQASADDLKDKRHHVQKDIKRAHHDLDMSSRRARRASHALDVARTRLDGAQKRLATTQGELTAAKILDRRMQARLEDAVRRLQRSREELAAGRQKVRDQHNRIVDIAVSNYQGGDPGLMGLSMVLTSQEPQQLTSKLNTAESLMNREQAGLDRLDAARVLLSVRTRQVKQAKHQVAVRRQKAAENLDRKQELERRAQKQRRKVAHLVSARKRAAGHAASVKRADLRELHKLKKERERISTLLRKRAAAARRRAREAHRAHRAAASSRASSGGYLSYPVSGPVTSPFGMRVHPIYGYRSLHDGVDFGVGCGQPIRAAAPGRVVSEYFQTAWGNRLILDNGYHRGAGLGTVYNHMSGYAVSTGQRVQRGQVLGYVGTTGWSTGCHLHFTVMRNGTPVDPMGWL